MHPNAVNGVVKKVAVSFLGSFKRLLGSLEASDTIPPETKPFS